MSQKSTLTELELAYIRDAARAKSSKDLKMPYVRMMVVVSASAQEVKNVRNFLKQSQAQLANWLGVSTQTVQAWEAGRRKPEAVVSKVIRYAAKHPEWVVEFARPVLLAEEVKPAKAKKPARHLQAA
jgi:DNA-binding transcriptional regulator YiaG